MAIEITTDVDRLDRELIYRYLHDEAYWCKGIGRDLLESALERSLCFGALDGDTQVGFARVVTDAATFAYLADVFVVPGWRGRGIAGQLVAAVLAHPSVNGLRRVLLATHDAHGLYERFGFRPLSNVTRWMAIELTPEEAYGKSPPPEWPPPGAERSERGAARQEGDRE